MAGELHDNAEARSITPNGAESSRLVVSNGEMATFQGQQRGGVSVTDKEHAMFANGVLDFGQAGNIYATSETGGKTIRIGDKDYPAEDVLAKGQTSKELAQLRADIQENIERITDSNAPLGNKMIGIAKELGRDPERWRSSTTGKCNQFVGEVIDEATGGKPWKGNTPDCHELNTALAASPDWEIAWTSWYSEHWTRRGQATGSFT